MKYILLFGLLLLSAQSVIATEPLVDQLTAEGYDGIIFPEKCCWLEKPKSKKLKKLARESSCSAIGGPISNIKLEDDRLFLTGLYKCGADILLSEVYPKFGQQQLATWLNGTYYAKLNYLCLDKSYTNVYEFEHTLIVKKGIVVSKETIVNDKSTCS